mgnify:FL=1
MSEKIKRLFNIYGFSGGSFAGNVYGIDGIAPTLNCMGGGNRMPLILIENEKRKNYRIRKLTQTECFRLQDVNDEDIEKMKQAGIAKTNLYKLAGNSIVVSCMYHIFHKLFIEKECENEQLSLF